MAVWGCGGPGGVALVGGEVVVEMVEWEEVVWDDSGAWRASGW